DEIYPIINNLNKVELSLPPDLFLNQSIALRVSSGNVTCFYEHVDVLGLCRWTYYFQTKLLKFQLEKSLFQALESCGQRIVFSFLCLILITTFLIACLLQKQAVCLYRLFQRHELLVQMTVAILQGQTIAHIRQSYAYPYANELLVYTILIVALTFFLRYLLQSIAFFLVTTVHFIHLLFAPKASVAN